MSNLEYNIDLNASGFEAGVGDMKKAMENANKEMSTSAKPIEQKINVKAKVVPEGENKLDAMLGKVQSILSLSAFAAIRNVVSDIMAIMSRVAAIIKETLDRASNIVDSSKRMGLDFQTYQTVKILGEDSGLGSEKMISIVQNLNSKIERARSGSKELVESFESIGIKVNELDNNQIFIKFLDSIKYAYDGTKNAAAATKILEVQYQDLKVLVDQLAGKSLKDFNDEFKKSGQILEDWQVNILDKNNKSLDRMGRQFGTLKALLIASVSDWESLGTTIAATQLLMTDPSGILSYNLLKNSGGALGATLGNEDAINKLTVDEQRKQAKKILNINSGFIDENPDYLKFDKSARKSKITENYIDEMSNDQVKNILKLLEEQSKSIGKYLQKKILDKAKAEKDAAEETEFRNELQKEVDAQTEYWRKIREEKAEMQRTADEKMMREEAKALENDIKMFEKEVEDKKKAAEERRKKIEKLEEERNKLLEERRAKKIESNIYKSETGMSLTSAKFKTFDSVREIGGIIGTGRVSKSDQFYAELLNYEKKKLEYAAEINEISKSIDANTLAIAETI